MTSDFKVLLCGTAALAALVIGASMVAAPAALAQPSAQPAASGGGLEEIVVTARRREERVQTVPIAITAFTQAALERKEIHEIHDLAFQVPSIGTSLAQSDANGVYSSQLRLRGLPGTEIYLADVPVGNADFQAGTGIQHGLSEGYLYDLEGLEVVKGPQGTLFGKNSVGGLISIKPQHPTNNFEGYLKATFGNYGDKEVEGAINIPVVQDKLLVRVAGTMQQRDGYTHDLFSNKDLDNKNWSAWRVGVTFRPTDDIENYFMYDGYWQDMNGSSEIVKGLNPVFILSRLDKNFKPLAPNLTPAQIKQQCVAIVTLQGPAFGPQKPGIPGACGTLQVGLYQQDVGAIFARQQALGPRTEIGNDFQGIGKDYFYGFTNATTWDIADNLTIKNIAAARIFKELATVDYAPIGIPILNIGIPGNNREWGENSVQYTEEMQLQGKSLGDKMSWVLGGFLEQDHPLGNTTLGSANLGGTVAGGVTFNHFNTSARSQALFAHSEFDLGDYVSGLKFTAGYRYTWDFYEVEVHQSTGYDIVANGINKGPDGKIVQCPSFVSDKNCFQSLGKNFSSPGWNVALEEQLDATTLLYIRSGNAYRPGGFNTSVSPEFSAFGPEHITDVEGGVKKDWDFGDIHARTNADIFHSDYKAIQVQSLVSFTDPNGGNHTNALYQNAAGASIDGLEFEGTLMPITGLTLDAHYSYIDAKYDKYPTLFGASASSEPFFYFPRISWGINAAYRLPLDESIGDVTLSANYAWYGHQTVQDKVGELIPIQPSHDLLNVRVDWNNVMGQPVDVGFFMKNALDSTFIQGVIPIYTQLGFTSVSYSAPRMFGVSLKYRLEPGAGATETPAAPYTPPAVQAPAPAVAHSYMVFFDFNKSDLTSDAVAIVDQAARNARPAKATTLTVTGHTDTVGSDAYNMRLSKRRAESVAAQLEKDGIPASEIQLVAKGKRDLLVPTKDGVKEPQNRRVTIVYGGATS